jgi:2-dehydropantoate 2-reductase
MSETWHILGVGSIGGLFAHRLHHGGATVRLLARSRTSANRTIRLTTPESDQSIRFNCASVADEGDISHLLITSKSWSAGLALQKVRHRINHQTTLVAMMNGMQHIADLRAVAPECPLFLASTTAGCHRDKDRWIAAGTGKTLIGHPTGSAAPTWFETWQRGVPALEWCTDIDERLIEKVAINACINPLTAVHRVKNGALLSEAFKAESNSVISEVVAILEELGHTKLASGLHSTVRAVMTDTAENTSSMLSDVLAGRRTEADSILGWLLTQSTHDRPTLRALLSQLQSIEPDS